MSNSQKTMLAIAFTALFFILTVSSVLLFNIMIETGIISVILDLLSDISLTQKVIIIGIPLFGGLVAVSLFN